MFMLASPVRHGCGAWYFWNATTAEVSEDYIATSLSVGAEGEICLPRRSKLGAAT